MINWTVVQRVGQTLVADVTTGDVLSLQPDGAWQTRPKGTAGPFEVCTIDGNIATYNPAGSPFAFRFLPEVPNTGGLSAIDLVPM